jgi:hypothetical protein
MLNLYRTFILLFFAVSFQPALLAAPAKKPLGADITKPVECLPAKEAEASSEKRIDVYPEKVCLDALKSLAKRKERVLELTLEDGRTKPFQDEPPNPECQHEGCPWEVYYRLIGFYPKHRIYVVREFLSEATDDIIVGMKICTNCVQGGIQNFNLNGLAHFSPAGDYVVGIEDGVAAMSSDTGITILSLNFDILSKVFNLYNGDNWEFVGWTNDKKLKVKTVIGESPTHPYDATIILSDDGAWRLHPNYK